MDSGSAGYIYLPLFCQRTLPGAGRDPDPRMDTAGTLATAWPGADRGIPGLCTDMLHRLLSLCQWRDHTHLVAGFHEAVPADLLRDERFNFLALPAVATTVAVEVKKSTGFDIQPNPDIFDALLTKEIV